MSTDDGGEKRPQLGQYQGLKITFSEGRWLPVVRSIESHDSALRGDGQLLGERLRTRSASDDELKLADDILNGRVTPGKELFNQRFVLARRQRVAKFVLNMQREHPGIKRESIVSEAQKRYRVARSEVFTSLKQFGPK
jgi:hypothetical protein